MPSNAPPVTSAPDPMLHPRSVEPGHSGWVKYSVARVRAALTARRMQSLPWAGWTRLSASLAPIRPLPPGRNFPTPVMGANHTDRPIWPGCPGMVPASEDSRTGGLLEVRHPHRSTTSPNETQILGDASGCPKSPQYERAFFPIGVVFQHHECLGEPLISSPRTHLPESRGIESERSNPLSGSWYPSKR